MQLCTAVAQPGFYPAMLASTPPAFRYSSSPKSVKPLPHKPKYRDMSASEGDATSYPINIMTDPRVFRGNTASLNRTDQSQHQLSYKLQKKALPEGCSTSSQQRARLPQPWFYFNVHPLVHDVDLSSFLTEPEIHVSTCEAALQTDEFRPVPPPRPYVPRKTGVDSSTQIEDVAELFVFDEEIEPLLTVLVSKTLEQAIWEVNSEEEFMQIREDVRAWNVKAKDEEKRVAQVEVEAKRHYEEMMEVKQREVERMNREHIVKRKVASIGFMRQILPEQIYAHRIIDHCFSTGKCQTPTQQIVRTHFIHALFDHVVQLRIVQGNVQRILEELMLGAQHVLSQTRPSGWMNSAVAQSSGSDPSNKTFMRVCLRAATLRTSEDVIVGPFEVSANDTVQEVEKMIQERLRVLGVSLLVPPGGFLSMSTQSDENTTSPMLLDLHLPHQLNVVL